MGELDLTEAVAVAARAYFEETAPITAAQNPWDRINPAALHYFRESMLPAITAAAPLIAAQVRAQVAGNAALLLAGHQMAGHGLSWNSADACSCGVRTMPDPGNEDVSVRRYRAFAVHQADILTRGDS